VSHVSEGRISALAHLVLAEIKAGDVSDLQADRLVLKELKVVLGDHLNLDEALDDRIRRKIASLSRRVPEGSPEWDVLYRQYLEEEKRKLGR
jgi:hypothetical protein